jgi:hypothetical protein
MEIIDNEGTIQINQEDLKYIRIILKDEKTTDSSRD